MLSISNNYDFPFWKPYFIYCLITFILFFEVCFTLFFPAIFIRCYYRFILYNWVIVLDPEFTVDQSPVTELTVRGRGYNMY